MTNRPPQSSWIEDVLQYLDQGQPVCRVIVAQAKGSTPREAGAEMLVSEHNSHQTIGGGALEFEAIKIARTMLAELPETGFIRQFRVFALGPNLDQCCGGQVTLLFEGFCPSLAAAFRELEVLDAAGFIHDGQDPLFCHLSDKRVDRPVYHAKSQILWMPPKRPLVPLYLYGAGHVGRALMHQLSGLQVQPVWVDTHASRFPPDTPSAVTIVPAADMTIIAANAPAGAIHIVMSYSHRLDEELVYALLKQDVFAHLGLIGSPTKYHRFCNTLKKRGIAQTQLDRLICPIGLPDIQSKKPEHVALSIAAQIAIWLEAEEMPNK